MKKIIINIITFPNEQDDDVNFKAKNVLKKKT